MYLNSSWYAVFHFTVSLKKEKDSSRKPLVATLVNLGEYKYGYNII
jgi:hypothetical protein